MSDFECQPPQWMLLLENKQKKQHRLAHEIGAGAMCLKCEGKCPGLDLHFWRKLCRNCKCKKEDHDVLDDDGYLQFEILLNSSGTKGIVRPSKTVLDLNLKKEDVKLVPGKSKNIKDNNKGIIFDWVPPDVSKDLVEEYMQQLPPSKMPITGSTGAQLRRQQLEYQIPLHDLTPNVCHDLTASEIKKFQNYLENIRNNVVGQGRLERIGMIPKQFIEYSVPCSNAKQISYSNKGVDSKHQNRGPKPFVPVNYDIQTTRDEDLPPPPIELLNTPSIGLKTPSEFLREQGPVQHINDPIQHVNYPGKTMLSDLSNISDKSKSINKQNNNQIGVNVNNIVQGSLNNDFSLNNNISKPILGSLEQNKLPYLISKSEKNQEFSQANKSNILQSSRSESNPSQISGSHNKPEGRSIQEFNNVPTLVEHSNQLSNQNQSHPHSIQDEGVGYMFINQPGFDSAPQGYKPVSDIFNEMEKNTGNLSLNEPNLFVEGASVAKPLNCIGCFEVINVGQVAVLAERAGDSVAWHPGCFVCHTCKELLVDLIYFFHKGNVFCGRHYADIMKIPRCFACDELIFVNEYTIAEGQSFHVRHFCCYDCDVELCGKQYIPKDDNPICMDCYYSKYGKKCHTCKEVICATDQGICWKHIDWHARDDCFRCFQCLRSLLGSKFTIKNDQPFCNKDCVLKCTSFTNA
uniref:Testin n=2 Tax=Clastoptera arizonana TaxID=38151 RepID=A0A1B6DR65_9HEMI